MMLLAVFLLLSITIHNVWGTNCTMATNNCSSHDRLTLYQQICCKDTNLGQVTHLKDECHSTVVVCPQVKPQSCPADQRDCKNWYDSGHTTSGIYTVNPDGGTPFQVYCNMEIGVGGWTVFQRRVSNAVDFYLNWTDYEKGFGHLNGSFWLGLNNIQRLTSLNTTTLRIDMGRFNGQQYYALYNQFALNGANYTLSAGGYSGNATDCLTQHSGHVFSTKDRNSGMSCAVTYKGAWWYHCYHSHLNGVYYNDAGDRGYTGLSWCGINSWESLKYARMMLRRSV